MAAFSSGGGIDGGGGARRNAVGGRGQGKESRGKMEWYNDSATSTY